MDDKAEITASNDLNSASDPVPNWVLHKPYVDAAYYDLTYYECDQFLKLLDCSDGYWNPGDNNCKTC